MANLDEPNTDHAGNTNGTPDHAGPSSGEQRLKELERENAKLRAELAEARAKHAYDRDLLTAFMLDGMPRTEEEFMKMEAENGSFSDLLNELEREFGLEPRQ